MMGIPGIREISGMLGMLGMPGMGDMPEVRNTRYAWCMSQDGIPPGAYPSFEIAEPTPWILGCGFREKD